MIFWPPIGRSKVLYDESREESDEHGNVDFAEGVGYFIRDHGQIFCIRFVDLAFYSSAPGAGSARRGGRMRYRLDFVMPVLETMSGIVCPALRR